MKEFDKAVRGDCDNDFVQSNFETICKRLEEGNAVWLYCWCTGHTRCAIVEGTYKRKLEEKYRERLKEGVYDGWIRCLYLE